MTEPGQSGSDESFRNLITMTRRWTWSVVATSAAVGLLTFSQLRDALGERNALDLFRQRFEEAQKAQSAQENAKEQLRQDADAVFRGAHLLEQARHQVLLDVESSTSDLQPLEQYPTLEDALRDAGSVLFRVPAVHRLELLEPKQLAEWENEEVRAAAKMGTVTSRSISIIEFVPSPFDDSGAEGPRQVEMELTLDVASPLVPSGPSHLTHKRRRSFGCKVKLTTLEFDCDETGFLTKNTGDRLRRFWPMSEEEAIRRAQDRLEEIGSTKLVEVFKLHLNYRAVVGVGWLVVLVPILVLITCLKRLHVRMREAGAAAAPALDGWFGTHAEPLSFALTFGALVALPAWACWVMWDLGDGGCFLGLGYAVVVGFGVAAWLMLVNAALHPHEP